MLFSYGDSENDIKIQKYEYKYDFVWFGFMTYWPLLVI